MVTNESQCNLFHGSNGEREAKQARIQTTVTYARVAVRFSIFETESFRSDID